ncbi:hypothetical protein AD954_05200 [Acetobacter cerevisiae]|uniref:Uncharacterized protein n=1 Tax=Acetobacter cerevisiae TaxID=178900 RepID=A0A149VCL9_9PROT|nr:hypothetical protein AD954_05200 [Acetobacter cerevisiae]
MLLGVIFADIAVRKLLPDLPFFITKWNGSWLWGMMMWCAVTPCLESSVAYGTRPFERKAAH